MQKKLLTLIFLMFFHGVVFAAAKPDKAVTLDFTLIYKSSLEANPAEHVMKDVIHFSNENWHVAAKYQNNKNDEVILLLVKQLAHHNNKYTFHFMMIDSSRHGVFISEPKVTAQVGLPSQMTITSEDRVMTLNTLATLSGSQPKTGATKVLQK